MCWKRWRGVSWPAGSDAVDDWIKNGKVRARITEEGALEVRCFGLTTQAKYYKPLLREFFRKDFTRLRPGHGDYAVHIVMEYTGDPPWMDLDNLAKALLDSVTGNAFVDDHQVARFSDPIPRRQSFPLP